MAENELFSVIILHYNQPNFVKKAIDSVLIQDYTDIELIFADDASKDIDLDMIKDYISKGKSGNIKSVSYIINDANQGTVKTINKAVKIAKGKYILFFAADDALYDENVITNFKKAFEKADDDVYMISSQCHMMDENLEDEIEVFVRHTQAISFNRMNAFEQFRVFASNCFLAIGATAMRSDMFERYGYFNERYKYVEDWAYFLHLTHSGGLIRYAHFDGLLHRDGGISHFLDNDRLPPQVLQYKLDMLNICRYEIFPYFKTFTFKEKLNVFHRYRSEKTAYYSGGGREKTLSNFGLFKVLPKYYLHLIIGPFLKGWSKLVRTVIASAYISVIYIALVACNHFLNVPVLSDKLIKLIGIAVYTSVGISILVLILSVVIKLLALLKKLFRGG